MEKGKSQLFRGITGLQLDPEQMERLIVTDQAKTVRPGTLAGQKGNQILFKHLNRKPIRRRMAAGEDRLT